MGELGLNKIFGAILAACLLIMGLQTISATAFSSGDHGGHHGDEEKPYGEAIKDKYAYWTDVQVASAGAADTGPAYDLGTLLQSADASKGERVFKSVCSSCHTINAGGADGTGPNLHGVVGRPIGSHGGFGYSSALSGVGGNWTYEQLDVWVNEPKDLARGVNMVANVKKDPDRMNLIAYLAANSPGAPAFPEPLPEDGGDEATVDGEAPAEGEAEPASGEEEAQAGETPAETAVEGEEVAGTGDDVDATLDEMEEIVERMEDGVEALEDEIADAVDEMPDAPEVPELEPTEEVEAPR